MTALRASLAAALLFVGARAAHANAGDGAEAAEAADASAGATAATDADDANAGATDAPAAVAQAAPPAPTTASGAPGQTQPEVRACFAAAPARASGATAHAGYDAAAGGRVTGDRTDAGASLTVDAGASVLFDVGPCPRGQELALDVSATPRWTGPDRGGSLDATATLRFGPSTPTDPDAGVLAWAATSWELTYAGALRDEPGLADRGDLSRDLFDRFTLTGATRAFRVSFADLCRDGDQREECVDGRGPTHPTPMTIDLGEVEGSTGFTEQGARRDEQHGSISLFHATMTEVNRTPLRGVVDLLKVESARVDLGGIVGTIDTIWPLYLETTNPSTSTRYVIGWGEVADFRLDDGTGREQRRDHRPLESRKVGGFGATSGGGLHGVGAGWTRSAYVTMAAEPVLEDRIVAEGWTPLDGVAVRARAFAARLEHLTPRPDEAPIVWTGGVELGGGRRVAGLDVDVTFEAGRSYYATLDGAAPRAGFGGRAQLTIHRAGEASWSR
ncbi:MAG TPA: hypothetical protein VHE35_32675 [Kofleriaceae bacterium]|nr:hypothetical protein [Kofleriaceae bacterium]